MLNQIASHGKHKIEKKNVRLTEGNLAMIMTRGEVVTIVTRKAIILDDDPVILSLLATLLARRGYEVITFTSPAQCPIYTDKTCPCTLEAPCPEIILTDLDMPAVTGIEFLATLQKKRCKCPHIAIMTGSHVGENDLKRIAHMGVKLFAKPFHPDQIHAWLNQVENA
jgi:CheY-like chemotaxis protein